MPEEENSDVEAQDPADRPSRHASTYSYTAEQYLLDIQEDQEEERAPFVSIFDVLDAPRDLPEPIELTLEHLKQVENELGLIKLCWPDIRSAKFEERVHFPESYIKNNNKERLLLLYAENFRRQFCLKYPGRKQLFLAADNECGMQKMVCTTLRPTTLLYTEIEHWQDCADFVSNQIDFEVLKVPVLIPDRLYSPHTTFFRQSGHSFELATCLCSLLLGLGYRAYMVSGYGTLDVTTRTMCRVDCPYPPFDEKQIAAEDGDGQPKYSVKPPRDLRSKFMLMMEQRKVDAVRKKAEEEQEMERLRREEEEKPPQDELEGCRVHAWILLMADGQRVEKSIFLEPSTGIAYSLDNCPYSGIESLWNNSNYWVNMQNCSEGLDKLDYDLTKVENWEHLLIGEPINTRTDGPEFYGMDEEEQMKAKIMQEKHLDMPHPWSLRINIDRKLLNRKFSGGARRTMYKRAVVDEFAPYVQEDGLVKEINRFSDFECTDLEVTEFRFENRQDKLYKMVQDMKTEWVTEYFLPYRDDAVTCHKYKTNCPDDAIEREITFNVEARHDRLKKIYLKPVYMEVHYEGREDRVYYRDVHYAEKGKPPPGMMESHRKIILDVTEKMDRNPSLAASDDIAWRNFAVLDQKINLRFHYGPNNVTASTREFKKPPVAEMGERLTYNPNLTGGYQAEVEAPPPRPLKLFLLLKEMLDEEEKTMVAVREIEDQVEEFLLLRDRENAFVHLTISLFNTEQNAEYREGLLEQEKTRREHKQREVEKGINYLNPYLAKLGNPERLDRPEQVKVYNEALDDFKALQLERARDLQQQYEKAEALMTSKKQWYLVNQDLITQDEETLYFEEINDLTLLIQLLEQRLTRHRDLSHVRYKVFLKYLEHHPMIQTVPRIIQTVKSSDTITSGRFYNAVMSIISSIN